EHHRRRMECSFAFGNIVRGQEFIGSRIDGGAVMSSRRFDNNEAPPSRRAGGLFYVGGINAFVAIEPQRHFAEGIGSNSGDETDFRSQPGASYCLVGTLSAIVHAISRSQKRLAGA